MPADVAEHPARDLTPFARLSLDLTERRQWVCYKLVQRHGAAKATKVPFDPRTGRAAESNNHATWATYSEALTAYSDPANGYDGIGYMFSADDPFFGVDFDNSLDEAGQLLPWARPYVEAFKGTYLERSPGLHGLHGIGRGRLPGDGRGLNVKGFGDGTGGIEIYDRLRYFTVSGKRFGDAPTVPTDCGDAAAALYAELQERKRPKATQAATHAAVTPCDRVTRCMKYLQKCPDANSGDNGHDKTVRAACECVRFDLSSGETWETMRWFNAAKCDEKWTDEELAHKIASAEKLAGSERGIRLREDRPDWKPHSGNGHAAKAPPTPDATPDEQAAGAQPEPPAPLIPDPIPFPELAAAHPDLSEPLIDGIARCGETFNLIAGSKRGKTWLEYGMVLSVATGTHWLATFPTRRSRVLILDNEMRRPVMPFRLKKVGHAMGLGPHEWEGQVDIVPLRGLNVTIDHLRAYFARVAERDYGLVVLDAFYKFLPRGMDENSNADMTFMYGLVDSFAEATGAAFCLIHHASKGVQGNKNVTDVGSGAGAQSRAADGHVVLRDHEEDGAVVMQAEVRTFARPNPLCLRWDFPLWRPDPFLDPSQLKRERGPGGRPRKEQGERAEKEPPRVWTPEDFAREFVADTPKARTLIVALAMQAGVAERVASRLFELAEDRGLIHRHPSPDDRRKSLYANVMPQKSADSEEQYISRAPPTPPRRTRRRKRRDS